MSFKLLLCLSSMNFPSRFASGKCGIFYLSELLSPYISGDQENI